MFTGGRINPQGQLCLSLNRPIIFRRCIGEILQGPPQPHWGYHSDAEYLNPITVVTSAGVCEGVNEQLMAGAAACQQPMTVSEGRIVLIKRALLHLLSLTGHCVTDRQPLTTTTKVPDFEMFHTQLVTAY